MEVVITYKTKSRLVLSTKELDYIFSTIAKGEKKKITTVSVTLMTPLMIAKINKQYRGKNKATDILSFPDGEYGQAGDLLLCPSYIKTKAQEYGHSLRQHYTLLCIHGMLHLLGYDHIKDKDFAVMKKREDHYFKKVKKNLRLSSLNY